MKKSVALITVGAFGHVLPTLPFVTELIRKGVNVTYFTVENFRKAVTFTGADFVPFDSSLTKQGEADKDINKDLMAELPLRFLTEADYIIKQILPVLEKARPDIIIYDTLALAGRLAAKALDVPGIQIYTSYAANEHFSISRNFPPVPEDHPARIAADKMAREFTQKYGVPHLDIFEIFEGAAELNIVLLQRAFHPAGDTFDNRYVFTGAQIGPRENSGAWQAPAGDKPLIYSSLGTLFNDWPEYYGMLFEAVHDLPVNVVTAIGTAVRPESLGAIPENVTLAPFLPQLDVLEQAGIFITHAGAASVMEAIYFGVPMIAIPQMPEQGFTAMLIEKQGLGKALSEKNGVTPELLRLTIKELLDNNSYREQVADYRKDMRKSGGYELTANTIIEFMNNH